MPYILKEENIEEFVKKSEIDEFEEEDFGELYPDDYEMVDKSGMFEDFRFKLVVLETLLGKNASFVEEFEKLKENFNFEIIFVEKKEELIRLFSRDVNVVGIFNKKVIKGILSKVEVMNG